MNDYGKPQNDMAEQNEQAHELNEQLSLLEAVDRRITPEHVARRFRELLADIADDGLPAPAAGENPRRVLDQPGRHGQLADLWPYGAERYVDMSGSLEAAIAAARSAAADIISDAQLKAKASADELQRAQDAVTAARQQAEQIVADARTEADKALDLAVKMVRDARDQAEQILSQARNEAEQILTAAQSRETHQTAWTGYQDGAPTLRRLAYHTGSTVAADQYMTDRTGLGRFDQAPVYGVIALTNGRSSSRIEGAYSALMEMVTENGSRLQAVVANRHHAEASTDIGMFFSRAATPLVRTGLEGISGGIDEAVRAGRITLTGWNANTLERVTYRDARLAVGSLGDAPVRFWNLSSGHGDLDGLRALADVGDRDSALQVAALLADSGGLDGLRDRAETGAGMDELPELADLVAALLIKRGRGEEAERLIAVASATRPTSGVGNSDAELRQARGTGSGTNEKPLLRRWQGWLVRRQRRNPAAEG